MRVIEKIINGNRYIIEYYYYFSVFDSEIAKYSTSGREYKSKSGILKKEYFEKLAYLDDKTFYLFSYNVNSGKSIYDYCDYLASIEKMKNLCKE